MTQSGIEQAARREGAGQPAIWQYGYPYATSSWPNARSPWQPFVDFGIVRPGTPWTWPRLYTEAQWEMFYRLGWSPELFLNDGTPEGGISGLKNTLILKNYFRVYSAFYEDALWAEPPVIEGDNDVLTDWLEGEIERLSAVVREAIRWWTVKDRMVVTVDGDGMYAAVDPSHYWPICAPWDESVVLAHLLAYPYRSHYTAAEYRGLQPPNRMRFSLHDPDGNVGPPRNDVIEYSLGGSIVGGDGEERAVELDELGEQDSEERADTVAIFAEGLGRSLYGDMAGLIRGLVVRESNDNVVLNVNAGPILWVPVGSMDPASQQVRIETAGGLRLLQASDIAERPPAYIGYDGGLTDSAVSQDRLQEDLQMLTGVPKSAYGINVGKGESGSSREALLFTAHSRILKAQEMLERIIRGVLDKRPGRPSGQIMIQWIEDPFTSKSGRRQQALLEYEAGMIDLATALRRAGYSRREAEQIKAQVREEQDRKTALQANAPNPANEPETGPNRG